jgi:ribosomal protein L21E
MEAIIKEVYESNFGTAYETYKEAVKKDNSIRLQGVKDYLNSLESVQVKSKPKTYNSFVSPGANFEYEIDIMDIEAKGSTSDSRYGLVAIDNFTKIAEVIPIKNRTPESIIAGLKKIIAEMGKPKQLYSDEESSMRSLKMIKFLKQNEIKSVQTTTHAHTVERFIGTFKDNLYRRLDALKQTKKDWFRHIGRIIEKYNSTEHSTIQIKPNEAGEKRNHLWVNWHLQNKAKSNRKYPDISKGDMVRVHIKPKIGTKAHEPKWSSTRHKVIRIDGNSYLIDYLPKKKLFLRHELLKV